MGFFSWKTQDTDRSIPSVYSDRVSFTVYMTDAGGNKWEENNYEGYGVFGRKDFYELLADMNGLNTRDEGVRLAFSGMKHLSPNLSESPDWEWTDDAPEECEYQGYFYPDEANEY
jgi:hypothetical protein